MMYVSFEGDEAPPGPRAQGGMQCLLVNFMFCKAHLATPLNAYCHIIGR